MDGEKDRLGDKLREAEHARENKYFAERDRALLEQLRKHLDVAELACPECKGLLAERAEAEVRVRVCPNGHGVWLAAADLRTIVDPKAMAILDRLITPPPSR